MDNRRRRNKPIYLEPDKGEVHWITQFIWQSFKALNQRK